MMEQFIGCDAHMDAPTTCARSKPSASSNPTASAAISERVYDTDDKSPARTERRSGGGASVICVESPAGRARSKTHPASESTTRRAPRSVTLEANQHYRVARRRFQSVLVRRLMLCRA